MGRRPVEDDQEEEQRRQREVARRRRPADDRGHGAGRSADDDVLRRRALEPARVDDHVEEPFPKTASSAARHVREARQHDERERRQREPELEGALGRDAAGGDGPPVGALHVLVDVAVEDVVQRRGATAGEREAAEHGREQPERRHAVRADERARGGGDQEQHHDAGLRERHVVAPGERDADGRVAASHHECRRDRGGREGERAEADVEAAQPGGRRRAPRRSRRSPIWRTKRPSATPAARTSAGRSRWPKHSGRRDAEGERERAEHGRLVGDAGPLAGRDDECRRRHGRDGREAEPGSGCRACASATTSRGAGAGGRGAAGGSRRREPCHREVVLAAAATSRTTPGYPPATGRYRPGCRCAGS